MRRMRSFPIRRSGNGMTASARIGSSGAKMAGVQRILTGLSGREASPAGREAFIIGGWRTCRICLVVLAALVAPAVGKALFPISSICCLAGWDDALARRPISSRRARMSSP